MSQAKSTDEQLADFVAAHVRYAAKRLEQTLARCGSPLEQLMAMAIINQPYVELLPRSHWPGWPFASDGELSAYIQYEQHVSGRLCRLDFAFIAPDMRLNVEVDGHDFHERTKEQARRDKSRDRGLTAGGWKVLRFTGQEVWEDVFGCVDQIWAVMIPGWETGVK